MKYTVREYIDLVSEPLPYTTKWGFVLEETKGYCPECNRPLSDMKQQITEYSNFIFVRPVGVCHHCEAVVSTLPFKCTDTNDFFILKDGQWYKTDESWLGKLMRWFRR